MGAVRQQWVVWRWSVVVCTSPRDARLRHSVTSPYPQLHAPYAAVSAVRFVRQDSSAGHVAMDGVGVTDVMACEACGLEGRAAEWSAARRWVTTSQRAGARITVRVKVRVVDRGAGTG